MKKIILICLLLVSFFGFSQEFKIDTKNAKVFFVFEHDKTEGTINDINATIEFNVGDLAKSVITGFANVDALSTGNKTRDKHLKSKSYFDAKNFPTIKFTSTEIKVDGDNFATTGTLTIKDVTNEVSFSVKVDGENIIFETVIYASDYGVSVKSDIEKNKVTVKVIVPVS